MRSLDLKRRDFLKLALASMSTLLSQCALRPITDVSIGAGLGVLSGEIEALTGNPTSQDPIQRLAGLISTTKFTGDEPDPNHNRFWNIDDYIQKAGGIPAVSETQNVIVVGGGVSGLISAYYLKKLKPLVLEQASQFGGNAKGEAIGTNVYSMGPAYISIPETNSATHKMLSDIGVLKFGRIETAEQKEVFLNYKVQHKFWTGEHEDPKVFAKFKKILTDFENSTEQNTVTYNRISVSQWLKRYFPEITLSLYEYFQYYCWSSFGATLDEVAAGEFLSWQASEQHGAIVFPGGNSLVTQYLFQNLKATIGPTQLRTKSAVLKVIPGKGYVDVVVEESLNKLKTIRAKSVVMANPKFVAKRIVVGLPAQQLNAMNKMEYRSYMVGNVTLKRNIPSKGYDLYTLQKQTPQIPSASGEFDKGFTDVVFSNWVQGDKSSPTTLTFYKAFPFQGARPFLLNPSAHNKHRDFLLSDLQKYYQELGITASDIGAVRMTLWGHAVPVCRSGFASSADLAKASQPFGNIFFANQDNSISPSFESAESAALKVAEQILERTRS